LSVLLFLDVDGTLLPFGAVGSYPLYEPAFPPPADSVADHPLLTRVDPGLGARLTSLGCELVWATTWGDDANSVLAPWLGLPRLPLVDWPDPDDEEEAGLHGGEVAGLHWKTRSLVSWASGRPFVWVDDEIRDADRAWVAAHHPERALLYRVDHQAGLTHDDFAALEEWLKKARR
jgi:hypothetical protein